MQKGVLQWLQYPFFENFYFRKSLIIMARGEGLEPPAS